MNFVRKSSESGLTDEERQELHDLSKQVDELPAKAEKFVKQFAEAVGDGIKQQLAERLELSAQLDRIRADIETLKLTKLAESRPRNGRTEIAKSFEDRGLHPGLAGIIEPVNTEPL